MYTLGEIIGLYVCRFSIIVDEKSPYLKLLQAVGIILLIDSCIPDIIPHSLATYMYLCMHLHSCVLIERTWMTHTYLKELALRR